jgi:hypothetical protein
MGIAVGGTVDDRGEGGDGDDASAHRCLGVSHAAQEGRAGTLTSVQAAQLHAADVAE